MTQAQVRRTGVGERLPSTPVLVAAAAAAMLVTGVPAFWPQYLSRFGQPFDPYTHVHAALGTAWLLLVGLQAIFVRRRAMRWHRAFGWLSYVLAPAFVVSGLLLAHHRFSRMPPELFEREGFSLYLPVVMSVLFALAFGLGVRHRREFQLHWRLMASTILPLVDPVLVRILFFQLPPFPRLWIYQAVTFGITAAVAWLLLRSLPPATRARRVYGRFFGVLCLALAAWFVAPFAPPWLAFAAWFRQLPLT